MTRRGPTPEAGTTETGDEPIVDRGGVAGPGPDGTGSSSAGSGAVVLAPDIAAPDIAAPDIAAPDIAAPDTDAPDPPDASDPEVVDLLSPADGVPPLVADPAALTDAAHRLAAGSGPVAVDAERASGFRYSARAYLVQLRREGAGTVLIDPVSCGGDLSEVGEALRGVEWVLHAASQDLPCLAEVGMHPDRLFDTELAGRLAGYPRVGLGPLAERLLGVRLQKGHGAADWSRRPLPREWLVYAALDVELLVEMRWVIGAELDRQDKSAWAAQEFEAVRTAGPPPKRAEPWRRTSGLHKVRKPTQLATVRALWEARDTLAAARDTAPGRLLPDAAIVDAALSEPAGRDDLLALPVFRGRAQRRLADRWWSAVQSARALPRTALPTSGPPHDGPPPAHRWGEKDPDAAARLAAARRAMAARAEETGTPVENLLQPETLRRLCWDPPWGTGQAPSPEAVAGALAELGARPWQAALAAPVLAEALAPPPAQAPSTVDGDAGA